MMPRLGFPAVSEGPTPQPKPRLNWWFAAIGVLAVAVIAFAAVQVFGDDDDNDSTDTTTPTAAAPATATSPQLTLTESVPTTPGGPEPPDSATLVVGTTDLFPALVGSLEPYANQQVTGKRVEVIEVNDESSLWVGRSREQRLLIVFNRKGMPFPEVEEGDVVDFVGQLRANDGNYGETDPESEALLERQGQHAFVSVLDFHVG